MRRMTIVTVLLATLALVGNTLADENPTGPIRQVHLIDGSIYSGHLIELVPGDHIKIMTLDGTIHTWPMDQVKSYDGQAPQKRQTHATGESNIVKLHAPAVKLRLESLQPNITFYYKTGESYAVAWGNGVTATARGAQFSRICTSPCEAEIAAGHYQLGLSDGEHGVHLYPEALDLEQPSVLTGSYKSNQGLRIAGYLIGIVGIGGGAAMMTAPLLADNDSSANITSSGLFWGGIGLMVAGSIAAMVMGFTADEVHISAKPL